MTRDREVIVDGYTARPGFDIASGWGTIWAPRFVPALVRAVDAAHAERAARRQAATALTALRHTLRLSPSHVTPAESSHLNATGFLPGLPVRLLIDGRRVATVRADDQGTVRTTIASDRLHLSAGTHTVTLRGMLISMSGRLTTH